MSSNFLALIYYPGVIGKASVDYAHPVLVGMEELGLNPYAQPANTSTVGTSYCFAVAGNNPGNDPKEHSETHWHRAWRAWAWRRVRVQGNVIIATEAGREDNATAYTPVIPFDFILTESDIPDKKMSESCMISGAGTYPIASIAHLGDASGGALVTNANMQGAQGSLGDWRFAGLGDSSVKYTTTVTTVTAYDANFPPGPDIDVEIVCDFYVSASGNSSVLRYVDADGNWQWVSLFVLGISAALRLDSELPSGYFIEGPDGSRNPDIPPTLNTTAVSCSTNLSNIGEDTTSAVDVGSVNIASTESLSPDPPIYESTETMTIDVPWLGDGTGTPTTAQRGVWSGALVTISDPLYAVRPALFP